MHKKIALALAAACGVFIAAAPAHATVCPFTDHFKIQAPLPLHIMSAATDNNLLYNQINYDYFTLSCPSVRQTESGNVFLVIGMSDNLKCSLTIHDGPYEMNPSVTMVSCDIPNNRISFVGMDHAYGSYNYILKFTM
jgi:hypothetical protein